MSDTEVLAILERAATAMTIRDLTTPRAPDTRAYHGQGAWEFDMDSVLLGRVIEIGEAA